MKKSKCENAICCILAIIVIAIVVVVLLGLFWDNANACYSPELCPPPHPKYLMYLPLIIAGSLPPWMK